MPGQTPPGVPDAAASVDAESTRGIVVEEGRMTWTEVFWIFLVLSALQPLIQRKLLEASRLGPCGVWGGGGGASPSP